MSVMRKTNWVAVYRMPADNYEHEHASLVDSLGDNPLDARAVLVQHTNPDIAVVKLYRPASHQQIVDEVGRIQSAPGYRGLQDSEQFLTAKASLALRQPAGLPVDKILARIKADEPADAARALAEAKAEIFSDPPDLIVVGTPG